MNHHHFESTIDVPGLIEGVESRILARGTYPQTVRGYPAYVGLDLSMTATGLARTGPLGLWDLDKPADLHRIDSKPIQDTRDAKGKPAATWGSRLRRMADIVDRVELHIPFGSLVFLEAPSYGSTGSGTFDRSGLWWMTYAHLVQRMGCRVIPVAPSQRMLYATGKGGGKDAGKDAVIAAVVRRYPDLAVTDNNVADAVVLMAMAARAAGHPLEGSIPAANLKALDKLEAF